MMHGNVDSRLEAFLTLRVRGVSGIEQDVDFLIDTGFDSTLVLPKAIADALGLHFLGTRFASLADGSLHPIETYLAQVKWHGTPLPMTIICIGDEPLIGMGLLNGHELRIEVTPGGMVEISELP
jgi:clan AA aspartic protease